MTDTTEQTQNLRKEIIEQKSREPVTQKFEINLIGFKASFLTKYKH